MVLDVHERTFYSEERNVFNYNGQNDANRRSRFASNDFLQTQDAATIAAKIEGLNIHSMGLDELRMFVALLDKRVSEALDSDHNVVDRAAAVTALSDLTLAEMNDQILGKSVFDLTLDELRMAVLLIDDAATTGLFDGDFEAVDLTP
jgi:hypothetical protein